MKKILIPNTHSSMKFSNPHPSAEAIIRSMHLSQGKRVNVEPPIHQVWLLTKGALILSPDSGDEYRITSGQAFFLSRGFLCAFSATEESSMFCFQIPHLFSLLRELYPEGLAYESEENNSLFHPLHGSVPLGEYIRHLAILVESCPLSPLFIRLQSYQLLLFFKRFYPSGDVARLFSPIIPVIPPFEQRVRKNYQNTRSLRELAAACHMGVRTFERQFKKTFGMPPGQWLLERRMERVYREIIQTKEPLMIVADKCGFHSPSQLSDFCRKYLGKTPSELRKGDTR